MANLKVYITQEYGVVDAVYATLSETDIAQLKLSYDICQYMPGLGNRYSFTPSMNPVDIIIECKPKDFVSIKSELTSYTAYKPWDDLGIKFGEPSNGC